MLVVGVKFAGIVKAINQGDFLEELGETVRTMEANNWVVEVQYKPLLTSKDQVVHTALVIAKGD